MDNRFIGAVGTIAFIFLAVAFALNQEGVNASFSSFFSVPAFGFVLGVGGALTFMKKHQLKGAELGAVLKENLILSGWLGLVVGLILMASNMANTNDYSISTFVSGLGAAQLTVLYGYVFGNIISVFVE